MIFGPALAIRGPDGSMSRAVEGMYAERKWALRLFWVGLFFIMLSGIALGWLKFQFKTAVTMTTIFIIFIVAFFIYVKYITRPRFRFPKDARRKPGEFRVAGYDPETGQYNQTVKAGNASGGTGSEEGNAALDQHLRAIREVEWLRQKGVIADGDADAKIAMIRSQISARGFPGNNSNISGSNSKTRATVLRNRMFGGGPSKGGATTASSTTFPHDADSVLSANSEQPLGSAYSDDGYSGGGEGGKVVTGSSAPLASPPDSSSNVKQTNEIKSGLLSCNGKLQRFRLSADGVLTSLPVQGSGKNETWMLRGRVISVNPALTRNKPFQFVVTIGGGRQSTAKAKTLKLEGTSEADMKDWILTLQHFSS